MTIIYYQHLMQAPGVTPYYNITDAKGFVIMTVNINTAAYRAFVAGVAADPNVLVMDAGGADFAKGPDETALTIYNPSDSDGATADGTVIPPWHQVHVVRGKVVGAPYPMSDEDKQEHHAKMDQEPKYI